LILAAVAAVGTRCRLPGPDPVRAAAPAEASAPELHGCLELAGLDPRRYEVRLSGLAFGAEVHHADLDASGCFAFKGLEDTDYRLELVHREQPESVLARVDYVRPGGESLWVVPDPLAVAGLGRGE